MKVRKPRQKAGQSLVLFALMMVFIIGMVGLAVDIGNTYGRERQNQNGANAAALAGMNTILVKGSTNQQVWDNVQRTLAANRTNGPTYKYWADYITSTGTKQPLGEWNGSSAVVYNKDATPPGNINRIQITVEQQVDTFFVRAFGFDQFQVSVGGNSCMGGYNVGVLPLAVPLNLVKSRTVGGSSQPYHRIYNTDGSELATGNAAWGVWDKMVNRSIYLPIETWTADKTGSHVGWLNWTGTSNLDQAMTFPGTLQLGFSEGPAMDARLPNSQPLNKLTLGDWVLGDTGVKGGLVDELLKLQSDQREIGLPIYDTAGKKDSNISFHIVRMGYFRVESFNMSSTPSVRLKYLGDKNNTATECAGEPNQITTFKEQKRYNINGTANLKRVWSSGISGQTSFDIVIVMDTSGSMNYDWADRKPGQPGYNGARIEDARTAVRDFVRNYDLELDPDARMSFITFGGDGGNAVRQEVGWATSGCTTFEITSTLCTDDMKWAPIQDRANSVSPNGLTPGPLAFEKARDLLADRRTPPAGKSYGQIVLFATDGVFNICGTYIDPGNGAIGCRSSDKGQHVPYDGSFPGTGNESDYYLNNPGYNQKPGRPIWQAQRIADHIKSDLGARVFVVALTPRGGNFSPAGLPEMSSGGQDYYFEADNANTLANIYSRIDLQLKTGDCIPFERTSVVPGAKVTLTQPGNPVFTLTTTADGTGTFGFSDLEAGTYKVSVEPRSVLSPEDGITRQYPRVVNANNPSEEGQLSIDFNPERPDGSISRADILWTTERELNGALKNGCSTP